MLLRTLTAHLSILLLAGCVSAEITPSSVETPAPTRAPVVSDGLAAQHLARLNRNMPAWLAAENVPSAAVAWLVDGEIAWTATWGEQAPGIPANDRTLYNIASLTKPIVAETLLRLASAGRLDLNAPMAPVFVDGDLAADPRHSLLTPALALSHRMGFSVNWRGDKPLEIAWEPGSKAFYSGEGYDYVARYAALATGTPMEALAREMVFAPVGMTDTWFRPDPAWEGRVAMVRGPDGTLRLPDNSPQGSAADNVHTTIRDYARFVRSAMQGQGLTLPIREARGRIYDDQVAMACPPGIIPADLCPRHTGYGLGWMIYETADQRLFIHNGKGWGENTFAMFDPDRQTGVVVFTSGAYGRAVISDVLKLLVDNPQLNALVAAEAAFEKRRLASSQ
ncbi:serine hydrolase domain-containing protein [uncultured Brevundimonas sp.]|uniref:serine hydrolase domain-containing protein n=1 Tax=uncultured Brevundimonas sp. TaxID=213418 RepID=UPI0030EF3B1C|tara:strand:- start:107 stop:1285 length:1179 start_codon:yes stop_codon:yes gene_type:complete